MKAQYWLILALGLALTASMYRTCNTENQSLKLQSNNETLQAEIANLNQGIKANEIIVETLYVDKWHAANKSEAKIAEVRALDKPQQDSLNRLLYPTVDSANLTYYHCIAAREQLALSDSIITIKDTIIGSLQLVSLKKDTIISNNAKELRKEEKKANRWMLIAIVAAFLNFTH